MSLPLRSVVVYSVIEAACLGVVVLICIFKWYPGYFFEIFNVLQGFLLFLFGLIVIGPVLSGFIYKESLVEYVNDLTVISVIRFFLVVVALHLFFFYRPIFIVFSVDRLVIVQAHQIDMSDISPDVANLLIESSSPPVVAARRMESFDLENVLDILAGAPDIEYRPSRYEPFHYQKNGFYQRFSEEIGDGSASIGCNSAVLVPLVYNYNSYSKAVFCVDQESILYLEDESPW